jgi:lysine 2,3-aminomutase
MYMADETKGANHFRTSIETGLEIIENLRGHTSGLAIPHFVIDAPGGGGKIPLLPNYVMHHDEDKIILRNYRKKVYAYKNYKDRTNPGKIDKKANRVVEKTGTNGKGHPKRTNGKDKIKEIDFTKIELPVLELEEVES